MSLLLLNISPGSYGEPCALFLPKIYCQQYNYILEHGDRRFAFDCSAFDESLSSDQASIKSRCE